MRWSILLAATVAGAVASAPAPLHGQQQSSATITFTVPVVLNLVVGDTESESEAPGASERTVQVAANVRWELVAYCSDGARVRDVDGEVTSSAGGVVVARGERGRTRISVEEDTGAGTGSVRYELRAR